MARFAALKVMVLPTQSLIAVDSLGWRATAGGDKVVLATLDRELESSIGERGLATLWAFTPALVRAARRNPTYLMEPAAMRALDPVRLAIRKPDEPLAEPFASQLRAMGGVVDARYALIPLELRFVPIPPGTTGRAVLRSAVVDARGAKIVWVGEVGGDPSANFGAEVLASLARRVADLVVAR